MKTYTSGYVRAYLIALAILLTSLLTISNATADVVKFNFSGHMEELPFVGNPLRDLFTSGDRFTGSFTVDFSRRLGPPNEPGYPDTTRMDMSISLNPGVRLADESPYMLSTSEPVFTTAWAIDSETILYQAESFFLNSQITSNDLSAFRSILTLALPLSSDSKPALINAFTAFKTGRVSLNFNGPNGPPAFGRIDSIIVVPLPAAIWLFGIGLLGVASLKRFKQTA